MSARDFAPRGKSRTGGAGKSALYDRLSVELLLPNKRRIDYHYLRLLELGEARRFKKDDLKAFFTTRNINLAGLKLSREFSIDEILSRLQAIADDSDRMKSLKHPPLGFLDLIPDAAFVVQLAAYIDPYNVSGSLTYAPIAKVPATENVPIFHAFRERQNNHRHLIEKGFDFTSADNSRHAHTVMHSARVKMRLQRVIEKKRMALKLIEAKAAENDNVGRAAITALAANFIKVAREEELNKGLPITAYKPDEVVQAFEQVLAAEDPILVEATNRVPTTIRRGRKLKKLYLEGLKAGKPTGECEYVAATKALLAARRVDVAKYRK